MSHRPRSRRSAPKGDPNHEADSIRIKADSIEKVDTFPRTKTHGGHQTTAKGNVEISVNRSLPGKDSESRPKSGTVLIGEDPEGSVTVTARRIEKKPYKVQGKDVATASKGVRIFGKLRRSKE